MGRYAEWLLFETMESRGDASQPHGLVQLEVAPDFILYSCALCGEEHPDLHHDALDGSRWQWSGWEQPCKPDATGFILHVLKRLEEPVSEARLIVLWSWIHRAAGWPSRTLKERQKDRDDAMWEIDAAKDVLIHEGKLLAAWKDRVGMVYSLPPVPAEPAHAA